MKVRAPRTVQEFLSSLPLDPRTALAEVDGWLLGDNADKAAGLPSAEPIDRQRVVTERIRLVRAAERRK